MTTGSFPEVSQTFVVDHIKGLIDSGWEVHVAARHLHRERLGLYGLADIPAHALTAPSRGHPLKRVKSGLKSVGPSGLLHLRSVSVRAAAYYAASLRTVLDALRPAVVHAHFAHNGLMASMAARGSYPVLVDFHGYDVLELPRNEGWDHFSPFLESVHGIVHSSFLEAHVASNLDIPLHRVTIGVDPGLFRGSSRSDRWPDEITLLTVGRLVDVKGHDIAIKAFAFLTAKSDLPEMRLVIIGDGPEREALQQLSATLGVADRVAFEGAQPQAEVATAMASADFLLVPSLPLRGWQESFCRVAVEGLASGLAVIGTNTGGLAETIGPGGWIVQPGDSEELAEKLLAILGSTTPSEVVDQARVQAAKYDIATMQREYNAVTKSLVRLAGGSAR